MDAHGFHLTVLGNGGALLEPTRNLDISQAGNLIEQVVSRLQAKGQVNRLYYDLSDLLLIDDVYYAWLDRLARVCKALDIRMICTQMQPTAAFALAGLIQAPPAFETALDLTHR